MVAFVVLTFTAVGVLHDARSTTIYSSSAEIEVRTLTPNTPFLGIRNLKADVDPEGTAARAAALSRDPDVLRRARGKLGKSVPPEYTLAGRASATPATVPGRVVVTVHDARRERAVPAANALASAMVASIERTELARFDRVVDAVRRERRRLGSPRGADLVTRLAQNRTDRELASLETIREVAEPAAVVKPAALPGVRASTGRGRALSAFVLGLSLAIIAAFLLDAVARRPRDPERLAAAAGLSLLGRVGRSDRHRVGSYEHVHVAAERLGRDSPAKTIVVTSAEPAAGKSTVALGLASAAVNAGRRVCLLECDLHRPVLASRLGVEGPGISEWLAGEARESDIVREALGFAQSPIAVIGAGTPRRRPGDVLSAGSLGELLSSVAPDHDLLIVDAPPLLAVSDALALVHAADGLVLCARAGRTTREELAAARAALDRLIGAPPAGAVVTGARQDVVAAARPPRARYRPHPRGA